MGKLALSNLEELEKRGKSCDKIMEIRQVDKCFIEYSLVDEADTHQEDAKKRYLGA